MKIIRITAMWCMSCLTMKKIWKKVFSFYPNMEIIDYDYDFDHESINDLQVGNILPELIIYKNGKEISRIIGECTKKDLMKQLEELDENN